MTQHIRLQHMDALDVHDGPTTYKAGSQHWYTKSWQRTAGCGPTNATALLHYLASTREGCAPLCPCDANSKAGFLQLMQAVWQYVRPGAMGVYSTARFARGAIAYAKANGVALKADSLPIGIKLLGRRNYEKASLFISQTLAQDLPVAFLNLSNGSLANLGSWHWVTIVAIEGDNVMICDQGQMRRINLRQWVDTSALGGGFVVLDV